MSSVLAALAFIGALIGYVLGFPVWGQIVTAIAVPAFTAAFIFLGFLWKHYRA